MPRFFFFFLSSWLYYHWLVATTTITMGLVASVAVVVFPSTVSAQNAFAATPPPPATTATTATVTTATRLVTAGGSGYGYTFDATTTSDVISTAWKNVPVNQHTMEMWIRSTDPHASEQVLLSYGAYNVRGRQLEEDEDEEEEDDEATTTFPTASTTTTTPLPYESADEIMWMTIPSQGLRLWRGNNAVVECSANRNAMLAQALSDQEWHHYAFSVDVTTKTATTATKAPPDENDNDVVHLYLDGQELDFGTFRMTMIMAAEDDGDDGEEDDVMVRTVDYEKAPYSNDWDIAQHADAADYYVANNNAMDLDVVVLDLEKIDLCEGNAMLLSSMLSPPKDQSNNINNNNKKKVAALIFVPDDNDGNSMSSSSSSSCSLKEQAQKVANAGAWIVLMSRRRRQQQEQEQDEEPFFFGDPTTTNNGGNDTDEKLSIPVMAIDSMTAQELATASADGNQNKKLRWLRRKSPPPEAYKDGFTRPVQRGGVLILGQEPDGPWSQFDPLQATASVMEEVRIWKTIRTPEQIATYYQTTIDDVEQLQDLNLYWTFDDPPSSSSSSSSSSADELELLPRTADSSAGAKNPGLVGNLPTLRNELTYADGVTPPRPPSAPLRLPTDATCPVVGNGRDVVAVVVPGGTTAVTLKSRHAAGADLQTFLVTVPARGVLRAYYYDSSGTNNDRVDDNNPPLQAGDLVVDEPGRTENKRVVYEAPADDLLDDEGKGVSFIYRVVDAATGENATATVRLVPHVVENPANVVTAILEDTLTHFALARPSQVTQQNMGVGITRLPRRGKLYQAQFDPDGDGTYNALAQTVDAFGPMEEITQPNTFLTNARGIVHYLPAPDESSANVTDVYDDFAYRFYDPESGLWSARDGVRSVIVEAVNDAPVSQSGAVTFRYSPPSSSLTAAAALKYRVLALQSVDADADAAKSFAERTYARIVKFPRAGRLYQYKNEILDAANPFATANADVRGDLLVDSAATTAALKNFAWASRVVRYSSQFSVCGAACYGWKNPACTSNDVLAGGKVDGTCLSTAWHASQILGPPETFPSLGDAKTGWDRGDADFGHEWIEIEFPFPVYITAFELMEIAKPGSLWRISTASEYLDDVDEPCIRDTCSQKTEWQTLWMRPRESVTPLPESGAAFAPPLCPSTMKSSIVRLDFDSSRVPGWNNADAARVTGTLAPPPGLVVDSSNRVVYEPIEGVHGVDHFSFASSDCLDEGDEAIYAITLEAPSSSDASSNTWIIQNDVTLETEPGQVASVDIDLTPVLQKIGDMLPSPPQIRAIIKSTTALGIQEGAIFVNISLANPTIELQLGVANRGSPFSFLYLWLSDSGGLTFRVRYRTVLPVDCVNGGKYDKEAGVCLCAPGFVGDDCSVEASANTNLGLAVGLPVAAALVMAVLVYLFYENKRKESDSVFEIKESDLKFATPPEVLGCGSFGLVLLAEYRGTKVAIKRAIPPRTDGPSIYSSVQNTSIYSSVQNTSDGNPSRRASNMAMPSNIAVSTKSGVGRGSSVTFLASGTLNKRRKMKKEFIEEMRFVSKMRHPCITTIMGAVMGDHPQLVMEYMEHGSLYDIIHNPSIVVDNEIILPILSDVAQGMRFLHSTTPQIIHGDLKSANVLVDKRFRAKIADFGLSRKKNLGGTGTPFWMAPELLRGESSNTIKSDVYSFGIILFEVYSRREPYYDEYEEDEAEEVNEEKVAEEILRAVADRSIQKRPPAPLNMFDAAKSLMQSCVEDDPGKRPTFEEVDVRVKQIATEKATPGQSSASRSGTISLFDIFPRHIAEALQAGRTVEAEHRDCVTIFFSDIVGFTDISSTLPPRKVAKMLDRLYTKFDALSEVHDCFKVETIGDAYMCCCNLVLDQEDHCKRIAEFAIDAIAAANNTLIDTEDEEKGCVEIRVGFHSGPVVADVVGTKNPRYCLFGDTVNTASRMESNSKPNRINCSDAAAKLLKTQFPEMLMASRGRIPIKGKGNMQCFWVNEGDGSGALSSSFKEGAGESMRVSIKLASLFEDAEDLSESKDADKLASSPSLSNEGLTSSSSLERGVLRKRVSRRLGRGLSKMAMGSGRASSLSAMKSTSIKGGGGFSYANDQMRSRSEDDLFPVSEAPLSPS